MNTTYEVTEQGLKMFDLLDSGIFTPESEAELDALMTTERGMEIAAMVVKGLEQHAFACEVESDRLRERAKAFNDQIDALKKRMTACLDNNFKGKVKTSLFTIWTQKSKDTTTAELIPGITPEDLYAERPDLVRVKYELDRVKTVAEYKAGRPLPELILFEERPGTRGVRIK
jgi:hypothetical protein